MNKTTFALLLVTLPLVPRALAQPADMPSRGAWTLTPATPAKGDSTRETWIHPVRFAEARLDETRLAAALLNAPLEGSEAAALHPIELDLPRPDGSFERFAVWESPMMEPGLARWFKAAGFPMKTYSGRSLEHPAALVRLDFGGPAGFHASVLGPEENWYIDPRFRGDNRVYAVYYKRDSGVRSEPWSCGVSELSGPVAVVAAPLAPPTNQLRHYRLATAATGEYTAFYGGTVPLGQAAIVTTVNRVNQIYERDLSIHMDLVANNNTVVYTNGSTDPYTNNDGIAMLGENQANIDAVIGNSNYDIGHVFSTNGGGIAGLGVVCNGPNKARGVTGTFNPVGDPFDIDYVAHEMGHQWGGSHPFNSDIGACSGGTRSAATAYEPGSGSSIQAYAGICGADNLQPNSDAQFHAVSLDQMINYSGSLSCATNTADGNNNAPTVAAGSSYTIPVSTPFELVATGGADADGDALTYSWEEWDLGPALALAAGDNGSSPILRTWLASANPVRIFPRLSNLLANTLPPGEILPTTSRTMNFRIIARDNHAGGGRVNAGLATMQVTSTTTSGPFLVTYPNTGAGTLTGTVTVTWNVANTAAPPVSAASVDILLSTDGGTTWPTTLAAATPNDGSQTVVLPSLTTATARIKVKGSGNIFFDISNENFGISPPCVTAPTFAGLGSATDAQTSTCGISLSWPAATANCGGAVSYAVYRSTSAGFTPGPANRIATGLSGTAYADSAGLVSGTTYYYVVRAAHQLNGMADGNLVYRSGAPTTAGASTPVNESFAAGNPPAGWTRSNGGTGTQQWTTANPGARPIPAGMTAPVEIIDSDIDGNGLTQDDSLISPAFSAVGATTVTLQFDTWFQFNNVEIGDVDVSSNNGSSWTNVSRFNGINIGSQTTASHRTLDITAAAAGGSQVLVRFHYFNSNWDWFWLVDNVRVDVAAGGGACTTLNLPSEVSPGTNLATAQLWNADKTTHTWQAASGTVTGYRLYRGTAADLPKLATAVNDACLRYDGPALLFNLNGPNDTPSSGGLTWYLVVAYNNAGPGSVGTGASGPRDFSGTGNCTP